MNKRIKKKWSRVEILENKVAQLMASNALLTDAMSRQNSLIEELKNINERNVQATNARFNVLETDNKSMRVNLDEAIVEFRKNKKKGLFGRK
ncbi:hypothetical protein NQZ98_02775 [Streptococcus suis]|uniref:hypothetical protein n=1 Tax=Streptococcus suis TaxID=1307 RepID=UPI00211C9149|nr:hypothetical protein [Streptococcus suis]UUM45925.1 hypothetical protein NQZ98_02775 [Streptococcus suis]HEL1820004.1 hypothetical protein [Streptococcus suis]HEL2551294.1 hypothetical protein [Streptococcus suis]HEM6035466.1 hypothetical protein [Streptococcus suis]HEM6052604.1 hypothetical protein [Streptococcus suis]